MPPRRTGYYLTKRDAKMGCARRVHTPVCAPKCLSQSPGSVREVSWPPKNPPKTYDNNNNHHYYRLNYSVAAFGAYPLPQFSSHRREPRIEMCRKCGNWCAVTFLCQRRNRFRNTAVVGGFRSRSKMSDPHVTTCGSISGSGVSNVEALCQTAQRNRQETEKCPRKHPKTQKAIKLGPRRSHTNKTRTKTCNSVIRTRMSAFGFLANTLSEQFQKDSTHTLWQLPRDVTGSCVSGRRGEGLL